MLHVPSSGCHDNWLWTHAASDAHGRSTHAGGTLEPRRPQRQRQHTVPLSACALSRPFRAFQRPGAYGFCIIDYYEEVLECLGEEILPFTNMAAKVLHEAVTYNGGQPNRNLGDAFLCVWKPQARLLAPPPHSLTHARGHVSTHARSPC